MTTVSDHSGRVRPGPRVGCHRAVGRSGAPASIVPSATARSTSTDTISHTPSSPSGVTPGDWLPEVVVDFEEWFDLEYVGADNERHRPIMLHRALFGSIERFFGVLIEHYAGAFPTWLAPVQVRVLPVAEAHEDHAERVVARLGEIGARVDWVKADVGLGKRIRSAKMEKIPYVLVVGDDDVAANTVGVNLRHDLVADGAADVERDVALATFIDRFRAEVDNEATAALSA